MTSKQSKSDRLKESQLIRAKSYEGMDTTDVNIDPPPGSVLADPSELEHNNTYSPFPRFYVDKIIVCRNCKKEEVWPAENQKWWYEEAKGNINTKAVLCRACRNKEKARKDKARRIHLEGIAKKKETGTDYMKIDPVRNPLDKLPPILKKDLDRNLCVCNEVLKMDIINAIVNGATTVAEIRKQTYATDGIGCCTQQVERLIECLCSTEKEK